MRMQKALFVILLSLLFATWMVSSVSAQQSTPSDDEVNAIARQLYCPVCENVPLDVCPTTACAQWRELIRQKLTEGWSEQEIKDYFVQQYGVRVLGLPPARGFNWLVYVVPPVAIIAGAYVLFRAYRSWKRPPQPGEIQPLADDKPPTISNETQDEYIKRMEDELRKH